MLIRAVHALPPTLPPTDAQYRAVMGDDDGLAAALAEHRVYLLDYRELDTLAADTLAEEPGQSNGVEKYVFAPIALFALPKGGGPLAPVVIQCGQDPQRNPLFFPAAQGNPQWWGWQMAKTVVQVAECNYHELFVHLARTHLVLEAIAVATHRCLAEAHPLYVLLLPHCIGTLFINNAAATSLIAPGGSIDKTFGAPIARAGWRDAPTAQQGHSEADWLAMLPSLDNALEQVNILTLLGSVHYRALGDYRSNDFPYLPWFEDPAIVGDGGPLRRFQAALLEIQAKIEARNTTRIPYEFLLPARIPNSINI